jgi:hypothetical protein
MIAQAARLWISVDSPAVEPAKDCTFRGAQQLPQILSGAGSPFALLMKEKNY